LGEQLESSYNTTTAANIGYNSASALQIRLETREIIENIELFLRGNKIIIEQDDKGKITTKRVSIGASKANDVGIQSILNWIQMILNPQVVQGNFPTDNQAYSRMYEDYIYWARVNLVTYIMENIYHWDIIDEEIDGIVNSVMNIVEPFMTRLIDNKERESYEHTVKHLEHSAIREGKEGAKFFGGPNNG